MKINIMSGKLYPHSCKKCQVEILDLREDYPAGLPMPLICQPCKDRKQAEEITEIYQTRFLEARNKIPVVHHKYVNLDKLKDSTMWFKAPSPWAICFYGKSGRGKTTKAYNALINVFVGLGLQGELVKAPALAYKLRSDKMNTHDAQMQKYKDISLLIIDDLMTEDPDPRDKNLIESLIGYREENRLKTIITTNATKEELFSEGSGYGERLKDRFADVKMIELKGQSKRASK